jgi:hypothetical protein
MTYLPRNFCKSDGCRPFGKFEWDPTITDSSIFLLLCKLLLRAFSSMRMFSSMLFLLCFYVRIPKGFYPSYPAISVVAIKDNNHQHAFVACSIFANVPWTFPGALGLSRDFNCLVLDQEPQSYTGGPLRGLYCLVLHQEPQSYTGGPHKGLFHHGTRPWINPCLRHGYPGHFQGP